MNTVVVIGGGASGTLAAIHLLRRAGPNSHVILISDGGPPGRGIAYGTTDPRHLLNVLADQMSALSDDPDDFATWAGACTQAFVARKRYGEYLGQRLRESAAASMASFEEGASEAVAVNAGEVVLASGARAGADSVILALGHANPAPLAGLSPDLRTSHRYVDNAWATGALDGITAGSHVLILGTALTFVDVVLTLTATVPQVTVVGVSRHGLLPHPHPERKRAPVSLDELVEANRASLNGLAHAFIARGRAAGPLWRDVFDGIRPHTVALWAGLSPPDRRRFLRHGLAFWDNHRHRTAPEVGAEVARLIAGGTVSVRRERIDSASLSADGTAVVTRLRTGEALTSDHVIRCTGAGGRFTATTRPLVGDLVAKGMDLDPFGLGFVVDAAGRVPFEAALGMPPVYVIGPARRGSDWESTALPSIRRQAEEAARDALVSANQVRDA